jgi:hypothetical protein
MRYLSLESMLIVKFVLSLSLIAAAGGCVKTPPVVQKPEPASSPSPALERPKKALSEIDLSKIGPLSPKGRVQDKDYQEIEMVDDLIANGKDSIPFLISKIDDGTVIRQHVMDYWPEVTVGDVALHILGDFSVDYTWTKRTIPGSDWEGLFGRKYDENLPFYENYENYIRKHGRRQVKAKWEKIWQQYKDRIYWDEKDIAFHVKDQT